MRSIHFLFKKCTKSDESQALASARRLALALRGHLDARGGVVFADSMAREKS